MSKITFQDIQRAFTREDLERYNMLCRELIDLTKGKSNGELWDMAQPPNRLRQVLDEVHAIRSKYALLKDEPIFRVWTFNIKEKKREELWW